MRVVTGEAKGKKLKSPKTIGTRPIMDRVKTALFDILAFEISDVRFLDLFAGTGGVGIEALSRGAARATFIEMSPQIVKLVRENLQITGMTNRAEALQADSFKFLLSHQQHQSSASVLAREREREKRSYFPAPLPGQQRVYDIIYVAPPQYEEMAARALQLLDSSTLLTGETLIIVQIHPKERPGVAAVECHNFALTDERRYGSTLLMFYRQRSA
ncbi:RsmD family RNA methyltransferase [Dictyobacter arantiisoli]|uniref:Methyltransferase n=1 Tax=Dictyobacter arantiisoli TaxID=2014874 RepID=A0A5A5T901_9CHLR|nr:RsmD family RNA methyltransferase [Dictyobacter arantiisoli]GCF07469.1 methyltransferase [Dictyobacter arantiisoli]